MKLLNHTGLLIILLLSFSLFINACQPENSDLSNISLTEVTIHSKSLESAVVQTTTPTIEKIPLEAVKLKLAWFYKPPVDDNLLQLARNFDFFILTKGDEEERDQLVDLGVQAPILQYLRFEVIQDPGACDVQPWRNQVAYLPGDFCKISKEHPDWFLLDQNGSRIVNPSGGKKYIMMDPGNPGWQAFFLERLIQSQKDKNWSGVFLDNVEVTFEFREKRNQLPQIYPTEADYQHAVQNFLNFLNLNYFKSNNKLLFANIVALKDDSEFPDFLPYLDGAMAESWAIRGSDGYRPPDLWETHMKLAEETQASGKFIILVSQGQHDRADLQQFAFASFLLVNNGKAAFRYAHSDFYNQVWLYDNYLLKLGQPLGPRYLEGEKWHRNYENGTVSVNPVNHEVEIKINQ